MPSNSTTKLYLSQCRVANDEVLHDSFTLTSWSHKFSDYTSACTKKKKETKDSVLAITFRKENTVPGTLPLQPTYTTRIMMIIGNEMGQDVSRSRNKNRYVRNGRKNISICYFH